MANLRPHTLGAAAPALLSLAPANAATLTTLAAFSGAGNGLAPTGALAAIGATLCGTTQNGGAGNGGTVFRLSP